MEKPVNGCKDFEEDLVAYVDSEVSPARAAGIKKHLEACGSCRKVVEDLRALCAKLKAEAGPEPNPEWEKRAEQAVRERAGKQAAPVKVRWRRLVFSFSMAALVLLIAGVGLISLSGDHVRSAFSSHANALAGNEDVADSASMYHHKSLHSFGTDAATTGSGSLGTRFGEPGEATVAAQGHNKPREEWSEPRNRGLPSNPSAYYESTYQPGLGDRERVDKLVAEGVVVDGRKVKLATFTRRYGQSFVVPSKTALAVYADLDHARILGAGGEVFLQVGIQASKQELGRRPPLNLALVIDRSGSMESEDKLVSVKRAVARFVTGLRPDDRVTLIAYNSTAEVIFSGASGRESDRMRRAVEQLSAYGNTDIHGALDTAYHEIGRYHSEGSLDTVILLSDGLPTAGDVSVEHIVGLAKTGAEFGISTTTVGVGLEYNDQLMMGVAGKGQGHYHFVKDSGSIEPIFDSEFKSLDRVVARALRLRIRLADGVVLKRVLGSKQLSSTEVAEARREEVAVDRKLYRDMGIAPDRDRDNEEGIKMLIPYFFAGDSHVVMLQLQVPPGTDRRKLADVFLKYKDLIHGSNGMDEREVVIGYAGSEEEVVSSIVRSVKKNLLGFMAGEALLSAAEIMQRGDAGRAAQMLGEQATLFSDAGRAWGDRDLVEDATLLGQYRDVVLSAGSNAIAGGEDLRSYLAKTMASSGYRLVQ